MKILYIGAKAGTSLQRAKALTRIGHDVIHVSPYDPLPRIWALWLHRVGGFGIDWIVARHLKRIIPVSDFDFAHVDSGDVIGPRAMAVIKSKVLIVTNYNADNPYADPPISGKRWSLFRRVAHLYDASFSPRRPQALQDMRRLGVMRPLAVMFCADELLHQRPKNEVADWVSEVCFVGTWMPGREMFMETLIDAGVPLTIYGPRWHKATNYTKLKAYIKGNFLEGEDYTRAIDGAKIALTILNGDNFDLHTTRSVEIPAIGTAMVAQRTSDHEEMYKEGEEAIFFDDAAECATHCLALLADPERLEKIATSGHARAIKNNHFNEPLLRMIVEKVMELR